MAKNIDFIGMIAWLVGILVSLAVGFGLINGVLPIPKVPEMVMMATGYIVVIGTLLGVLIAGYKKFS